MHSTRLYSSRHDEERHNHTPNGQQRNMLLGERNEHMFLFITIIFCWRLHKEKKNTFTRQSKLHDSWGTACHCCVYKTHDRRRRLYLLHRTAPPAASDYPIRSTSRIPASLPYGAWSPGVHSSRKGSRRSFRGHMLAYESQH